MRVIFDRSACVGHGRCYALAPEVFDEDESGYCVVLTPSVPEAQRSKARMAVENCPEQALRIEA